MKTRVLLAAVLIVALAACTTENASVQIQAICFPPADCTFGDTCDAQLIGNPVADVTQTSFLTLFLQVSNQLANNASPSAGRVNTYDAHVEETIVGGMTTRISSVWIPAQGSSIVGVTLPAMPGRFDVELKGHFADGSSFKTPEFPVVVDVCSGCAGTCPAGQIACPGLTAAPGQLPFTCFEPTAAGTT